VRSSVPDLCRVGQEIRRRTPSCSPRAEEGCAHSGAVGGKRAGSFPSLTPAGPWRRWRGCVRHEGGSVAAAAVAVAAGGSRRCRSRHWRKHRPAAGKHGNKGGAWQQQWATGTESAEPRGYRAASPATPPGVGGVGTRFLRTGCTVLWQLSQNWVGSEFTIPRPFPFAVHGGTEAARVAGIKYCQVAEKGELSVKTRYSCSTSTPVLDLIHAPRHGCPNAACRNRTKTLLRATRSSHAHVEHLHTFAYGHSHYGPVHHRRRFQRRF